MNNQSPICRWCKKPITEFSYTSKHNGIFCCEGCYLGYIANKNSKQERDEMQLALVEALAAALDARSLSDYSNQTTAKKQ